MQDEIAQKTPSDVDGARVSRPRAVIITGDVRHLGSSLVLQQAIAKLRSEGIDVLVADEPRADDSEEDLRREDLRQCLEQLKIERPAVPTNNQPYWRRFEKRTKYR